jgi:hypothetical protein
MIAYQFRYHKYQVNAQPAVAADLALCDQKGLLKEYYER